MRLFTLAIPILVLLGTVLTRGAVQMPSIFGDHMVLQGSVSGMSNLPPAALFGSAASGEKISADVGEDSYSATADSNGRWKITLNPKPVGTGPLNMTVSGASGPKLSFVDVWFGQVILCSGQSNMGVTVSYIYNASATIADANYPNLRLFKVGLRNSTVPLWNVSGTWQLCTPQSIPSFSAVCYLTGLWMMRMVWGKAPLGLIASDWGGTPIEAWMSPAALHECNKTQPAAYNYEELSPANRNFEEDEDKHKDHSLGGPRDPSVLYNAMINPLIGYTIHGALWYQGEANVPEGRNAYKCLLTSMIKSWRMVWEEQFPFMIVQLAPYKSASLVAELRLSQTDVLMRNGGEVDGAGTAIIIDLGDPTGTIHPHNKTEVGRRLALQYINVAMQGNESQWHYSGPLFESATFNSNDGSVMIKFSFADGLYWNDTHGCEEMSQCCDKASTIEISAGPISSAQAEWVSVNGEISEGQVTIKTLPASIKMPKAVRMEYSSFPGCALYNQYQLPVEPFVKAIDAA